MFANKKIVLGITGGIAAYKAADIASWLTQNGAAVHCMMTPGAVHFISPQALQALSHHPVVVDEFVSGPGWGIVHIDTVQDAGLLAIIPATANTIAKIAAGIADNALTSAVLAATCPLFIAPAMNTHMYQNPATQQNIRTLKSRGWHVMPPASGHLACGTVGEGKLPDVADIEAALQQLLLPKRDLVGLKILVTAGPTVEPVDPVRYISNKSSGKMGYAIAEAARDRGAEVLLVSGHTNLPRPAGVQYQTVETAAAMLAACLDAYDGCDVVIKAAAVADYRMAEPAAQKLKKADDTDELVLRLVKNPDILAELGRRKTHQLLVGFAAETNNVEEYARQKLAKKHADLLVANDVSRADAGFDVDTNQVTVFAADGDKLVSPLASKRQTADFILDAVRARLDRQ